VAVSGVWGGGQTIVAVSGVWGGGFIMPILEATNILRLPQLYKHIHRGVDTAVLQIVLKTGTKIKL